MKGFATCAVKLAFIWFLALPPLAFAIDPAEFEPDLEEEKGYTSPEEGLGCRICITLTCAQATTPPYCAQALDAQDCQELMNGPCFITPPSSPVVPLPGSGDIPVPITNPACPLAEMQIRRPPSCSSRLNYWDFRVSCEYCPPVNTGTAQDGDSEPSGWGGN